MPLPTTMLRGSNSASSTKSQQNQQPQQANDARKLQQQERQDPPEFSSSPNKNPLNPTKDAATRPFNPESFFKGNESFEVRPSSISYFPDQVIQLSYVVSVMQPTPTLSSRSSTTKSLSLSNSSYLADLKEAMDILATELAPQAYPGLWVRELTTSVDGWFSTVCPSDTNLQNCQDITSTIGIYLSTKPNKGGSGNTFDDTSPNLEDATTGTSSTKKLIDPSTLTSELRTFQKSLEDAVTSNRLQAIVESLYSSSDVNNQDRPPVFVLPTQVSSIIVSGGGGEEGDEENDNDNTTGEEEYEDSSTTGGSDESSGDDQDIVGDEGSDGDDVGTPDTDDDEEDEGTENIQIGVGGEGELAPDSGNDLISSGGDSEAGSGAGNDAWLPGSNGSSGSTATGGETLPAINGVDPNGNTKQSSLSTGNIIGIVAVALAAVLVVVSLVYLRRRSRDRRNDETQSRNIAGSPRKGKKKSKSSAADADKDDLISRNSSRKGSLGQFLYGGVRGDNPLASSPSHGGTDHSRGTVPTVTSTMSENTDASVNSGAAEGGRGADTWRKDEVLVPINTSRGLLTLDSVNEEKRSEDEDDPNDPLLGSQKSSGYYLASASNSELDQPGKHRVGAMSDDEEVYHSDSVGSSGWSSNGSPSTVESPLKSMAARSIRALRGKRKGSKSRSKQDLEDALSRDIAKDEGNLDFVDGVALGGHDADDESSPTKKKNGASNPAYSPAVASADGSYGSAMADVRPLSSLDEAIMKGDWAAVGATAALMAASVSPDDKGKKPTTQRPSLNSAPPEKSELDRLIDEGDWQAVMVAAARYDAADAGGTISTGEEGSRSARSRSSTQGSDTMDSSYYSGADHSSAYNSTMKGSVGTNGSQKERVEEIRAQVERLVREVVPDEVENIDEMMTQFKGKEEELLETLRTMKERDVVKKARMEAQKIARRNTRSKEKAESQSRDPSSSSVEAAGEPPSESDDESDISPEPVPASGSFAQATNGKAESDRDAAAAAAAEWAIERSLSELMEKEHGTPPTKGEFV